MHTLNRATGSGWNFLIGVELSKIVTAVVEESPSKRSRAAFAGQARLLARRAEAGLPLTSASLARLVQLGEQLDAELLEGRD